MVISTNRKPSIDEFILLLHNTTKALNMDAQTNSAYYISRAGNKLEQDVYERMKQFAIKTPFENSIQLISGQKFPDIVAHKYYGVEVKTTTQNHWKTTGNSVMETTRVDDVETIFLLFGKLVNPVEFRYKPYEMCLSEVVVTHSPRYLIDMNLKEGHTIFDKISIAYNDLRSMDTPTRPIVDYYKSQLKDGEELWWMDSGNSSDLAANSISVKLWNTLEPEYKNELMVMAIVLYPEIFGRSPQKYNRLALWLVARYGIFSTSLRDTFTAGGRVNLCIGNKVFKGVPHIYQHVFELSESIRAFTVV